jgi:hypothetical protein
MSEPVPLDLQSTIVIFLGPISVAALLAALAWWVTHRPPRK